MDLFSMCAFLLAWKLPMVAVVLLVLSYVAPGILTLTTDERKHGP